jgi:hypothetical protein
VCLKKKCVKSDSSTLLGSVLVLFLFAFCLLFVLLHEFPKFRVINVLFSFMLLLVSFISKVLIQISGNKNK